MCIRDRLKFPPLAARKALYNMMIAHIILAVLGTAWFLYSFIRERKVYQLLFVVWIPLTLLTYVSKNKTFLTVLGIVQLLFFILVIYFLFRNPNRRKGGYRQMLKELDSYGRDDAAQTPPDAAQEAVSSEAADQEEAPAKDPIE